MPTTIQLKRGLKANLPATIQYGEPILAYSTIDSTNIVELFTATSTGTTVPLKIFSNNVVVEDSSILSINGSTPYANRNLTYILEYLKQYIDNTAQGLAPKESVKTAALSNIDLTTVISTINGITINDNDRILLLGQTDKKQNGIYYKIPTGNPNAGKLARTPDFKDYQTANGALVFVEQGTSGSYNVANTLWVLSTDFTSTTWPIGSTNPTVDVDFVKFSSVLDLDAGAGLTITQSGATGRTTVALDTASLETTGTGTKFLVYNPASQKLVSSSYTASSFSPYHTPNVVPHVRDNRPESSSARLIITDTSATIPDDAPVTTFSLKDHHDSEIFKITTFGFYYGATYESTDIVFDGGDATTTTFIFDKRLKVKSGVNNIFDADIAGNKVVIGNSTTASSDALVVSGKINVTTSGATPPFTVNSTQLVTNLNADKLDGYDASISNTANTIPVRDSGGTIQANLNGIASQANALTGNVTINLTGLVSGSGSFNAPGTVNITTNIASIDGGTF